MNKTNKKAMAVNTVFYIMMSIFMIAIIFFGFQQIFNVSDQLNENERVEIIDKIKKNLEKCEDPLNKNNLDYLTFQHQSFNTLCIVSDSAPSELPTETQDEIDKIIDSEENVILLKTTSLEDGSVAKAQIVSSFRIENVPTDTQCFIDTKNTGKLIINLECK